ncbi:MAG: 3-deoxy-7-phosphoheptulonate synthase [Anaerolineae bacterium]
MIIVMEQGAAESDRQGVIEWVEEHGFRVHISEGEERTISGVIGNDRPVDRDQVARLPGVVRVVPVRAPYKLASLDMHPQPTTIPLNGRQVGGSRVLVIAGPCSVESKQQILEVAHAVREAGAMGLRGGAFKPRTSPYSFQGLKEEGLELLAEAREETGLAVVTEVMAPELVPVVAKYTDVLQVGARNMQNYPLLEAAGESGLPVLLKRGPSATIDEFLLAAEYILKTGNTQVMLCERGIRTFEDHTRFTLPLATVPYLQQTTHLPIVIDPSHGTGKASLVAVMARAAVASGADGLMVEVHPDPAQALSDGFQALTIPAFQEMMLMCRKFAKAMELKM